MKKQLLFILPALLMIGSVVSVSADEGIQSVEAVTTSTKPISLERQALQEKARLTREENKQMRNTSKDARKDFRTANTGAIREMKKELTEEDKLSIKKAHDERREYVQSLSGMTLEQKAQYMSGMEDKIRHEIETRYANAT